LKAISYLCTRANCCLRTTSNLSAILLSPVHALQLLALLKLYNEFIRNATFAHTIGIIKIK
jgi:hypothetical protein